MSERRKAASGLSNCHGVNKKKLQVARRKRRGMVSGETVVVSQVKSIGSDADSKYY